MAGWGRMGPEAGGSRFAAAIPSPNSPSLPQPQPYHPPTAPLVLPPVPKLSVTVITKNEAADIGEALASVAWADEIVVVDSQSTDDTVAIARRHTDRVVVRDWPGYIDQKNYAASIASHDWILSLDADERVTPALAAEIRTLLADDPRARGVPHSARHVAPGPLDSDDRLVSGLSSCGSTIAGRRSGPGATCTKR